MAGANNTTQVQIHIDDVCKLCKQKLIGPDKKLVKAVMKSEDASGLVHDACFMPFHKQEHIKILINIPVYSIGDTIACSPIIRETRRLYPFAEITVMTMYPDLFKCNPKIDGILDAKRPIPGKTLSDFHFVLKAFNSEQYHHFATHSVEFAFQSAFNRSPYPDSYDYDVSYSKEDHDSMLEVIGDLRDKPLILVHPHGTEWPTRDWGPVHMNALCKKIHAEFPDHTIVSVGGKRGESPSHEMKNYVPLTGPHVEMYGKLSLLQSIAFFDLPNVKLFVTPDTGTLHMAACTQETPIVGIFTLIRSFFRTPSRHGRLGYKFRGINADSPCNCTYLDCKLLTHETNFTVCPKKTQLEAIARSPLPKASKAEAMRYYDSNREWKVEHIAKQARAELSKYEGPSLPCFPSVDKVFAACKGILNA